MWVLSRVSHRRAPLLWEHGRGLRASCGQGRPVGGAQLLRDNLGEKHAAQWRLKPPPLTAARTPAKQLLRGAAPAEMGGASVEVGRSISAPQEIPRWSLQHSGGQGGPAQWG